MAQKRTVALIDDLDGSPAVETVRFSPDGKRNLEIDLSATNATRLRSALAPFMERGRRKTNGVRRSFAAHPRAQATDTTVVDRPAPARKKKLSPLAHSSIVREWARAEGFDVADRGRLSDEVIRAYRASTRNRRRSK